MREVFGLNDREQPLATDDWPQTTIPDATDYLHDIHDELVEVRKLQERIVDALERIAENTKPISKET